MGITPAVIGGALSMGSSLLGMFNSDKDKPQAPQTYQPQNLAWADNTFASQFPQFANWNTSAQTLPQYGEIAQQGVNNIFAPLYQNRANATADTGWLTGMGQVGAGTNAINSAQSLLPYAQQILQQSFDPLGNVYRQNFQQNTDQTRAALEARGLSMSPYGAGVENQSNINFNNSWDANLLARMTQGAQGASSLTNSQIAGMNAGTGIQTAGLNTMNNAASLPYSTANTITGNQLGLLDRFGGAGSNATNTGNVSMQDLLAYLGYGNQAGGVANSNFANQTQAQNNQFNQSQTLGKNLGAGLQGVFGNGFKLPGSQSTANPYGSMPMAGVNF